MKSAVTINELDQERKNIYNRYKRGWVHAKMVELHAFSERTGYDWSCLHCADCRDTFGPDGYKRCSNCLGFLTSQ